MGGTHAKCSIPCPVFKNMKTNSLVPEIHHWNICFQLERLTCFTQWATSVECMTRFFFFRLQNKTGDFSPPNCKPNIWEKLWFHTGFFSHLKIDWLMDSQKLRLFFFFLKTGRKPRKQSQVRLWDSGPLLPSALPLWLLNFSEFLSKPFLPC